MLLLSLIISLISGSLSFSHLDIEDGLSQSSVFAIEQDRTGCMWFGTYDGLCRFDGNDIEIYRNNENENSINCNIIRGLLIDSDGVLWIGTDKGFSVHVPGSGLFRNIPMDSNGLYIFHLAELDENHIIACAGKKKVIIDRQSLEMTEHIDKYGYSKDEQFFKLTHLGLVSTSDKGEIKINHSSKITTFRMKIPIKGIRDIVVARDSCMYIASEGDGFWKYDLKSGEMKQYPLRTKRARALCSDNNGNVWIGTANNLYKLNTSSEEIIEIAPDSSNTESLSNGSVRSLFCDNIGGVWAGTFFGGVNYFNPWRNKFYSIRYNSSDKDVVGCVKEDINKQLWVGTFRDGIIRFDPDLKRCLKLNSSKTNIKDETKDIKSIVFDNDVVYMGAELGGLDIYYKNTGRTIKVHEPHLFSSVYCITRTATGAYWLGTDKGLFRFDPSDIKIEKIEGYGLVRRMHKTSTKEIWIGGDGFLARCTEVIQNNGKENILATEIFSDISWVQDINGSGEAVWIGTRNGLYKYSLGRSVMEKINASSDQFSVKAIEIGGNGILWLSTEDGIYRFDSSTEVFRHYGRSDGLICNTYNIGAREKLSDGSICFGGIDGITLFNPSDITPQTFTPEPLLTKIMVDGERVGIPSDGKLDIPPGKSVINIKFSSPDYVSWKNVLFRYKLEGFDNKWHNADISRTATYSNLPKGLYCFKVESSNADGIKSLSSASLSIRIHPYWYQTTIFYIFCSLVLILLVSYLINNHIRGIKKDTSEQIEGLKLRLYSGPKAEEQLSEDDSQFLKKVLKVVYDNLSNENFSADMFAKEMGLSRTGLHSRLKSITGESALEFIKKVRFNEACSLLRKGDLTIAQIGYKVGYSSPAYFTSSFKKRIGKTPKEYQKITGRNR